MANNTERLRNALGYLHLRYEEQQRGVREYTPINFTPFYDILAEDVEFHIPCTTIPPEGAVGVVPPFDVVGVVHKGKQALIDAFTVDQSNITGWEIRRPLEYFESGDRVVVLLSERYLKRGTAVPWSEGAMVFDFRGGKVVRYTHLADMSGYITAVSDAEGRQHSQVEA